MSHTHACPAHRTPPAILRSSLIRPPPAGTPDTIAVARQPFTVAGEPCAPLGSVLRQLAPGHVAAASSLCRPSSRLMVDLYDKNPLGGLKLRAAGVDVLEALHAAGADVTVCPDVAAAKVPPSKALQSSQEVLMVAPTAFVFNEEAAQVRVLAPIDDS